MQINKNKNMFEQICNQYLSNLCINGTFLDADLIGVKEDAEISKAIVTVSLNNNIYERQIIIKKVNNELTWNFVKPIDENELNYNTGDWNYPNYQKRIVAPLELIMDDNGIKMYGWFQLNNLPVKTIGNNVYLYCNLILPQHQLLLDSFGEFVIVEDIDDYNIGTSGTDGTDGSSGTSGTNGTDGSSGTSGTDGTDGSSGTSFVYNGPTTGLTSGTSTMDYFYNSNTEMINPGNTYFRLNNTDLSLVNQMCISKINSSGENAENWLNSLNINDNINIFKYFDHDIFGYYMITNIIDNIDYFTIDLYHINSNGQFEINDDFITMVIG